MTILGEKSSIKSVKEQPYAQGLTAGLTTSDFIIINFRDFYKNWKRLGYLT